MVLESYLPYVRLASASECEKPVLFLGKNVCSFFLFLYPKGLVSTGSRNWTVSGCPWGPNHLCQTPPGSPLASINPRLGGRVATLDVQILLLASFEMGGN